MKKSYPLAIVAALVLTLGLSAVFTAEAQQSQPRPSGQPQMGQALPGVRIALIDIDRIFKNNLALKGMMEQLSRDFEQTKVEMKQENDSISKLFEELQSGGTYKRGTPQFKEMEETIAKRQAEFTVKAKMKQNEFVQRRAAVVNSVYQDITRATDAVRQQYSIDIVLRFNNDPVDVNRPESVGANIEKQVVSYNRNLDITDAVVQQLSVAAAAPGSPNPPATANRNAAPARPANGNPVRQ